jgi:hypothetical protein
MPPLLIDFGAVPALHCDCCLETLHKALAESPSGDAETIWAPHENPALTAHVEDVTRRFQAILAKLQDALSRFLTGESLGELQKADVPWLRWDEAAFERARAALEGKPSSRFSLDDWMLLADYLIQKYLPAGVIQSEADYLTVRAALMGKIQGNMEAMKQKPNVHEMEQILELMPMDFAQIPDKVLSPIEQAVINIAKLHAAENISNVTDDARHRMRVMIIEHTQARMLGMKDGTDVHLRQRLFDSFGQLNRDFRRIAVTESGEACNQGYIASLSGGARVIRQEAYRGACPFCKSISGHTFTVVEPSKVDKNGDTEVWVGKTNIGRSASPRKRQGGELVERESNERWWVAAGVMHPNCRGSWALAPDIEGRPPGVSEEYAAWLDGLLATAGKRPTE